MGIVSVMGAVMNCSAGETPAALDMQFPPIFINAQMVAQINDVLPEVNITPFGICAILTSLAKVPVPCTYMPMGTWLPTDPTILIDGIPIVFQPTDLECAIGGQISIDFPGQVTVMTL
jgi:hypothetical protein